MSPLREQVAARLAAHRERRGTHGTHTAPRQAASIPKPRAVTGKSARVIATVTERYAKAQSYRDYLAAEAEEALRRAQAAAEVAARNAEAIAAAQQELLRDIAQWNAGSSVEEEAAAEFTLTPEEAASPAVGPPDAVAIAIAHFTEEQVGSSTDFLPLPAHEADDLFAFEAFETAEPVEPTPLPANLIQFPRVLVAPRKARPRLAEGPLREEADLNAQLRIFEVDSLSLSPQPAQASAMTEWSSIRLDAAVPSHAVEHPQMPGAHAVPIQTAALRSRVAAFTADTALAAAAMALFAGVFLAIARHAGAMPEKKTAIVAGIAVFFALKLVYQVLFFTLNEYTPGMRMARIALCTFGDENPTRKELRRRIGATVLATCPMGLGLIWGWFDDDRLGWHDRMTRTYQRSY